MKIVERVVPVLVRLVAGLIFAGLGALAGIALAGISLPPGTDRGSLLAARVLLIGLGAAAGAVLPWWHPTESPARNGLFLLMIASGAVLGAAAGLAFAEAFQGHYDPLRRVQQISRTILYGAALGANVPLTALEVLRLLKRPGR